MRALSIRSKLLLVLLAVGLLCIAAVGLVADRSGRAALTAAITAQVTQLRDVQRIAVERMFREQITEIRTLAALSLLTDGVVGFADAFRELQELPDPEPVATELAAWYRDSFLPELAKFSDGSPTLETYMPPDPAARRAQRDYIVRNPNPLARKLLDRAGTGTRYDLLHGSLNPGIRRLAEDHGYDDIILVEASNGQVVYNLSKQIDLGANLRAGPAAHSSQARAFQRAMGKRDPGAVVIEDFQPFAPDMLRPTAFIATPLYRQGDLVGVLLAQLGIDRLNDMMTVGRQWERVGLSRTGEVFLVGQDRLMRSDSRFMLQDPESFLAGQARRGVPEETLRRMRAYRSTILLQELNTFAVRAGLRGDTGTGRYADYRGEDAIVSWAPIDVAGLRLAIVAKIDVADALAPAAAFRRTLALIAAVAVMLLTLVSLAVAGAFTRPLRDILAATEGLAAGDGSARIVPRGSDDYRDLAIGFNRMAEEIAARSHAVEAKTREYESLLRNVYPEVIAERVRLGETVIAETLHNVTLIVIAIDGLESAPSGSNHASPLNRLNELVDALDEAAHRHGVEKIKTLGESYIGACGLSVARLDHARRALAFVEDAARAVARFGHAWREPLAIRASITSGDVETGLVGRHRTLYDIWGRNFAIVRRVVFDTEPGHVGVTASTFAMLPDTTGFAPMPSIGFPTGESVATWQRPALPGPRQAEAA